MSDEELRALCLDKLVEFWSGLLDGKPSKDSTKGRTDDDGKPLSCVLIHLDGPSAALQKWAATMIRAEDLAEKGIESEPHVTIRFGLHDQSPYALTQPFAECEPIKGTVTEYGSFSSKDYDVLFLKVNSQDLLAINQWLGLRPNTQTHANYSPHLTVAYLKPGLAETYLAVLPRFSPTSFVVREVEFSNADRKKWTLPLRSEPNRAD